MPLSRLENFLKNTDGNILYVNPSDLDATDSIENQGNSLTRPFKTIQRALLEAARFSYNIGQNNDKFDKTTILLYPGTYEIDNRPGFSVANVGGNAEFRDVNGNIATLSELTVNTNYDIQDPGNDLYKFNSVHGGVIVPRGTSIVGLDLRKTKIRPKFVPEPETAGITSTSIFKITGGCYFWQFSIFDGDINSSVYYDYAGNTKTPTFSHHKLAVFEYADGVNGVGVGTSSTNTDLSMYYYKVAEAYGDSSGRAIGDFPTTLDFEPNTPEFKIVGALTADDIGISSVGYAGNLVTIDTATSHGLNIDDPIRISGFTSTVYNGSYNVVGVASATRFQYRASATPSGTGVLLNGAENLVVEPDTVNGASPYIFNCSMRSVFGMSGLNADGGKATGFKSVVVAQFTGISLQKDDNAFVIYDKTSGTYQDENSTSDANKPLHLNSRAIYKPEYSNYHIRAANGSFIQCVSIFAIGYANHFLAESGGDLSITNSNSNFGAKALVSKGYRAESFDRDDVGYITHVIPPKDSDDVVDPITWVSLDVGLSTSTAGVGTTSRLYCYDFTDPDNAPPYILSSYRLGAKSDELLNVLVSTGSAETVATAPVLMPTPDATDGPSGEKSYKVIRVGAANSITSNNTLNLETDHKLFNGESVRVFSDNGAVPDGMEADTVYFAITGGLATNQVQLAKSLNDAITGTPVPVTFDNTKGGVLTIVSRVSDKTPGDFGHPVQYDTVNKNWYIVSSSDPVKNRIHSDFITYRQFLTDSSSKTYINRRPDTRSVEDRIYRFRYVIPKEYGSTAANAKPPSIGYIIQESKTVGVSAAFEFAGVQNAKERRNLRIVHSVSHDQSAGICTVVTERPHRFNVGDNIKINNIRSANNPVGAANSGFNGTFPVVGVTSDKGFTVNLSSTPGTVIDVSSTRNENLPTVSRESFRNTYTIYTIDTLQEQIYNKSDGVYHVTCLANNVSPTDSYFTGDNYGQSPAFLYPTRDRDNYNSDPGSTVSYASNEKLGKVSVNDRRHSLTKETVETFYKDIRVGTAVTNAKHDSGITTYYSDIQHGLNSIKSLSLTGFGTNYGYAGIATVLYNASLIGIGITGEGATVNISVSAGGTVNGVTLVDGGSAYGIGQTMTIVGIRTEANWSAAVVTVSDINNNVGDTLEVVGVGTTGNRNDSSYNGLFRISGVSSSRSVTVTSSVNPGIYTTSSGFFYVSDETKDITDIQYTNVSSGIVTVITSSAHGLSVGNRFSIVGSAQTVYNGNYTVRERLGITSFTFYRGVGFNTAAFTGGNVFLLRDSLASQNETTSAIDEKLGSRMIPFYAGIGTVSSAGLTTTSGLINLESVVGFSTGDYLQIDNEIIRIADSINTATNTASVLRGVFGTRPDFHQSGSVARRIKVVPTELRRHSIIRASGHTFEYVGFGHGNYSVSFPQRQNRNLTREDQLLAQSIKQDGGTTAYTGTNDAGEFYVGNKIIDPVSGKEASINIPTETYIGEADSSLSVSFDDVTIANTLQVNGGPGNFQSSEFRGPINAYKKITSNSADGIEAIQYLIKGDASQTRSLTVGISTPTTAGTQGDVVLSTGTVSGGYAGWLNIGSNNWRRFGLVSRSANSNFITPDQIGINTTTPRDLVDIRNGGIIVQQLRVTGIVTFDNGGLFNDITFGSIDCLGVSTFRGNIEQTAGIATFTAIDTPRLDLVDLNVTGISTFGSDIDQSAGTAALNRLTVSGVTTVSDLFVTNNVSITGVTTVIGIGSFSNNVNVTGITTADKFVKRTGIASHFLKANGDDAVLTSAEVTSALGFTPANAAAVTGDYPLGNSLIIDDISSSFNGSLTDFTMNISGSPFIPSGSAANVLVSLGGVIQKPGTDFLIVQSGGNNTSTIRFTTPPPSGVPAFLIAMGGQGSLTLEPTWNAKGDLIVASGDNSASILPVGSNGQALVANSAAPLGVNWATPVYVPAGAVFYFATASAPSGYLVCDGQAVSRSTYAALFAVVGTSHGSGDGVSTFNVPNLVDRFAVGSGSAYSMGASGGNADATLVSHTHTASVTDSGHSHGITQTDHSHSTSTFMTDGGGICANRGDGGSCHQMGTGSGTSGAQANITINNATTGITVSNSTEGSSATNANLPPYYGLLPVIKY